MLAEEGHDSVPGILRSCCVVRATLSVEERMARAGIDLDVVIDLVLVEGLVEGTAGAGGEVLLGVRAYDRTRSPDHFDRPWVGGVEGRDPFEAVVGAGPPHGESTGHAE